MGSTADLNIKEAIQKSTSEVSLNDLAKQGFKNVKVLNREMIQQLIAEAVDRVISDRMKNTSSAERQSIELEARKRFDELMQEQRQTEKRLLSAAEEVQQRRVEVARQEAEIARRDQDLLRLKAELAQQQTRASALEAESTQLRADLAERDGRLAQQSAKPAGGEQFKAIQEALEKLSRKIASGGGVRGAEEIGEGREAEFAVRAMLEAVGEVAVESNVEQVDVKEKKASGVNKTLEKLKNMQKGSGQ